MFSEGIAKPAFKALAMIAGSRAGKEFYLAGGTAAAIQLGHRLSMDLDYFSPHPFHGDGLIKALEADGIKLFQLGPSARTLHCVIAATKISFLHYPYPLLKKPAQFKGCKLASLLDIALMKTTAIASRGAKKDFIDLYFIIQKITLQEILDSFPLKFPIEKLDPYHYIRSLTYFADAESDPMPHMLKTCHWQDVKSALERAVGGISLA